MPDHVPDWFEDERFWSDTFQVNFTPDRFAAAEDEVDGLLRRIGREPHRCLDLACGPGRHVLALARRGIAVTGVDKSAFLLGKAAVLIRDAGLTADLVRADVRTYSAPARYDLIIHLFNSFGYFSEGENTAVLQNCFANLAPGGWLAIEAVGSPGSAADRAWIDQGEGGSVITRTRSPSQGEAGRLDYTITVERAGRATSHRYDLMAYTAQGLGGLLTAAGFIDIAAAGSLDGRPYDQGASRLIVFARKASTLQREPRREPP